MMIFIRDKLRFPLLKERASARVLPRHSSKRYFSSFPPPPYLLAKEQNIITLPETARTMTTTEEPNVEESSTSEEEEEYKLHISRVPIKFTEDNVQRILEDKLGSDKVKAVELIYPKEEDEEEEKEKEEKENDGDTKKEHRGFGFVTFHSAENLEQALKLETIRGGRKPTAKKQHTLYLRPYSTEEGDHVCYLWSKNRCPYGDECKFVHSGPGGCLVKKDESEKKKGKCFAYKKTGNCPKGDDCPFSHDFEPKKQKPQGEQKTIIIPKSEKECINWKTKGKCRKGDNCPYRHDEAVQQAALKKLEKKKRTNSNEEKESKEKEKQPLSIRIFGMNYETTEQDVREFLKDCGPIKEISFQTFEDSGRSKGYCGVWFSSPKAVEKAVELDGKELMGRWLSIQAGKMYLKQWEESHSSKRIKLSAESE
jgi:RNA recognition motif-containing protein